MPKYCCHSSSAGGAIVVRPTSIHDQSIQYDTIQYAAPRHGPLVEPFFLKFSHYELKPTASMSESRLDQIVKGAPPPDAKLLSIISREPTPLPHAQLAPTESHASTKYTPASATSDPLSTLPSSPPQIYLNLLILETSLRSQYLELRARRRQHTFFLFLLAIWVACFSYALFLRPREDGRGVGGSVYWVVEMAEKVALMGGVVTGILIWGTGQWERGVRWPRRWLGVANRGLRGMNTKIVIIRGPWWKEMLSHLSFLFPYSSFFPSPGSSYHYVEHSRPQPGARHLPDEEGDLGLEEDLAPGGDHIKLLLLPKSFSPEFRENWEEYRADYWEKENERRALLRQRVRQRERQLAKQEGGWLWWAKWSSVKGRGKGDVERPHQHHHSHRHIPEKELKHRRSIIRSDSHSRTSSRSTTPNALELEEKPLSERARRGSSNGSTRKKAKQAALSGRVSPLTQTGSRPSTPVPSDSPLSWQT